jgi:hypothetical protein
MSDVKLVTLHNGAEEPDVVVMTTMLSLGTLFKSNPIAVYELVQLTRNPSHQPFGNTGEVLQGLGLVGEDGRMHDSVRNVVQSAIVGEDLDMSLRHPVKQS